MGDSFNLQHEWLDDSYIAECLRAYHDEPDLEVTAMNISAGSVCGDNFTCQIIRIEVFVENSSNITDNINLILKIQPPSELMQDLCDTLNVTQNEADFYAIVLPKYLEVMVDSPQYFDIFPKCYKVDIEKRTLVLEDLKTRGMLLLTRGEPMVLEQAELVMDALAIFHGFSQQILAENPDMMEKYDNCLWGRKGQYIIEKVIHNAGESLKMNLELLESELPEKYVEFLSNFEAYFHEAVNKIGIVDDDSFNVLNHGDAWRNNMLFHFDETQTDAVALLDFQVLFYGSFTYDLQFFMFTSLPTEIITTKLDYLLERYYQKLCEVAPDIADSISFERINAEFKNNFLLATLMSVCIRPITLYKPFDVNHLFTDPTVQDFPYKSPEYISDLRELLPLFEASGAF